MAIRRRLRPCPDQRGFTLVELLMVMLIIALLAGIALPTFLNQREKAHDVEAKSAVRNARQTLETYHTDRASYDTTVAGLTDLEPSLRNARNLTITGTDTTFSLSVDATPGANGGTYTISLDAGGNVLRTCSNHGKGGCRATADTAGNYW
ncbi:MAG TPA: prepilin-type N-terminal cleavage/methylation domain-containing protein [Solirubrobacteraceae bacterium]|nr:prepilin-type N-terminal cleavage/methylation domain-containing protein [Solirubrobacteraceae bacterium]